MIGLFVFWCICGVTLPLLFCAHYLQKIARLLEARR